MFCLPPLPFPWSIAQARRDEKQFIDPQPKTAFGVSGRGPEREVREKVDLRNGET